mmetsp:Transcript_18851/g.30935  ORF Transcript_18851/g.30935 Transcript_18851/m.30935 type:complete len:250 (-) Transcript_18851:58-807(-)
MTGHAKGHVEFHDLVFRYPSRPSVSVLNGFNLSLEPGKTVALVGASGSGKSTTVSLLLRLYDPSAGRILLDGVDVSQLDPYWLREQIGLVPQEPILFADSIRNNIRYGRLDASDEEVERVAREANLSEFVDSLPEGFDTLVGERGAALSGGQKQRVAIARALLKNPAILILDEATSNQDMESERVVQDALARLRKGRSTLIVAHRLTTIQYADLIAVLKEGRVVEFGTYEQLLERDQGVFRGLLARASL